MYDPELMRSRVSLAVFTISLHIVEILRCFRQIQRYNRPYFHSLLWSVNVVHCYPAKTYRMTFFFHELKYFDNMMGVIFLELSCVYMFECYFFNGINLSERPDSNYLVCVYRLKNIFLTSLNVYAVVPNRLHLRTKHHVVGKKKTLIKNVHCTQCICVLTCERPLSIALPFLARVNTDLASPGFLKRS